MQLNTFLSDSRLVKKHKNLSGLYFEEINLKQKQVGFNASPPPLYQKLNTFLESANRFFFLLGNSVHVVRGNSVRAVRRQNHHISLPLSQCNSSDVSNSRNNFLVFHSNFLKTKKAVV